MEVYFTSPRSHHPYSSAEESVSLPGGDLPAILTADSLPSTEPTRRMIESSSRASHRRLRSSVAYAGERSSLRSSSLPTSEQVLRDASGTARGRETSKEKRDDKDEFAGFLECNICFDMATEPVVTSCGHLFCWPCLYQWLHIHSGYKECPVCKGEVTEDNITPIYGSGNSSNEKDRIEEPESTVKIPQGHEGVGLIVSDNSLSKLQVNSTTELLHGGI